MISITALTFLYALLGGVIPAVIWLKFWLREDREHPEPKGRIIYTFLAGGFAIVPVFIVQRLLRDYSGETESIMAIFLAAAAEEIFKFGAAYWTALRTRFFDEPMDAVIYTVTAALGFSAFENVLYVLQPFSSGDFLRGVITGNFRFIGPSLLHIATSLIIGSLIAFAFYRGRNIKRLFIFIGLVLAAALHTAFNFLIIYLSDFEGGKYVLGIFIGIWVAIILLILIIERVKFIKNNR